jgi:hypothetical protein
MDNSSNADDNEIITFPKKVVDAMIVMAKKMNEDIIRIGSDELLHDTSTPYYSLFYANGIILMALEKSKI